MANRMNEGDRIERTIRSLLRLPENKRCINCNSLGPQYVCTTFLTFVCTNCSGVHREFTHRVKSVSMANFSAEEVSALQAGGNERARQIYFKAWDTQRHPYPDASNVQRLREFIKHVYVDKKYTGVKSLDKLPRLRLNEKESSYESRKVSAYRGGSRSSGYEDRYTRHYSERSSPGRRSEDGNSKYPYDERISPRYPQENSTYGDLRRSPASFEVVDDRFRDGEYGRRRASKTESKIRSKPPNFEKNTDRSHSPVVHSARVSLGDTVSPLQVGELSKAIDGKDADGSANTQKIASSSDLCSTARSPAEHKQRSSGSLIDWSPDPNPLDAGTISQTHQMPPSDRGGNWVSYQHPEKRAFQAPTNTLESLLFEFSAPSVVPASDMSEGPSNDDSLSAAARGTIPAGVQQMSALPISVSTFTTASTSHCKPAEPFNGGPPQVAPSGNGDSTKIPEEQKLYNMQQCHHTASPEADGSPIRQQTNPPVGPPNNQLWISSIPPNEQSPLSVPAEQSSQADSKSAQDISPGVGSEPLSVETNGRKELPADLFTASYTTVTAPVAGWQNGSPYGMGFSMQYYSNATPIPAFPNPARSTNPFDLDNKRTQVKAPPFSSMASVQGALPNVTPASGLLYTPSLGIQSSGLMAPQSPSYASAMPPHSPSFVSAMPPVSGAYMGIQKHDNTPRSRSQGLGTFGSDDVFGSLNTIQQLTGKYSAPSTSNHFSSIGGNPFG
ncbi:probable ADP-ribosylation factor GTPase-activating protein AGD14 isoform X1 [Juglans microcarpa x Juglans regia]|uniref:probable ADP-ribosylation factor GTPase-activating protein AGD14 isoform X1 n=1 Tax=Juglans microcarpa x Juglans regia TaxID=2249226 RepID=UPI001B7F756A|nr:probable ADP-ribosylation factor GTPase-activating protein AGD14 isoform X1 [Juglans microcarpa x Juglans regia]XP_041019510.1 probable ADP-ribosylation factor GTPase-activating protein AGD14 isoform X1 [Juglans microcarpa x Juglans regia]